MVSKPQKSKILSMPGPPDDEPLKSSFTMSVGGKKFRINLTADAEDITDEPEPPMAPLIAMPPPKPQK